MVTAKVIRQDNAMTSLMTLENTAPDILIDAIALARVSDANLPPQQSQIEQLIHVWFKFSVHIHVKHTGQHRHVDVISVLALAFEC